MNRLERVAGVATQVLRQTPGTVRRAATRMDGYKTLVGVLVPMAFLVWLIAVERIGAEIGFALLLQLLPFLGLRHSMSKLDRRLRQDEWVDEGSRERDFPSGW